MSHVWGLRYNWLMKPYLAKPSDLNFVNMKYRWAAELFMTQEWRHFFWGQGSSHIANCTLTVFILRRKEPVFALRFLLNTVDSDIRGMSSECLNDSQSQSSKFQNAFLANHSQDWAAVT